MNVRVVDKCYFVSEYLSQCLEGDMGDHYILHDSKLMEIIIPEDDINSLANIRDIERHRDTPMQELDKDTRELIGKHLVKGRKMMNRWVEQLEKYERRKCIFLRSSCQEIIRSDDYYFMEKMWKAAISDKYSNISMNVLVGILRKQEKDFESMSYNALSAKIRRFITAEGINLDKKERPALFYVYNNRFLEVESMDEADFVTYDMIIVHINKATRLIEMHSSRRLFKDGRKKEKVSKYYIYLKDMFKLLCNIFD
jgi:hypothetical protein